MRLSGHSRPMLLAVLALAFSTMSVVGAGMSLAVFTDSATDGGNAFQVGYWADLHLHNNPTPPTGNTTLQANLTATTTASTQATLYNYDTDCDFRTGRLLQRVNPPTPGNTTACQYVNWRLPVQTAAVTLAAGSTARADVWSATQTVLGNRTGSIVAYLRDYDPGTGTYVELGNATYTGNYAAGRTFYERPITILLASAYTIAVGHQLELKLESATANSQEDMMVAYDTTGYPSFLRLSYVGPAELESLAIPTPGTQTAGVAFPVSITAKDAFGNTVTSYTGSQCLTFSGPGASPDGTPPAYPAQGSCAAGQSAVTFTNGVAAAVPITLYNPSTSTVLTATDAPSGKAGSTGSFTVNAGPAARFAIPTPGTQTAGTPFSVSITALDAYGSTIAGYTGSHCLVFSGPAASPNGTAPTYPAQGSCAAGQSAVTFTNGVAAAVPITLYNASAATVLTATEGSLSGSTGAFTVNARTIASLRLAAATTTPTAGAPNNLTITALDSYGNTAPSYTGSHNLTFSGATAVPNSPFTPNVVDAGGVRVNFGTATAINFTNGVATVSGSSNGVMRLYRGGTFSIVVSDGTYTNGAGLSVTVTVVATQVSAGGYHTCALLSYGGIECWGRNNRGQLGDNSVTNRSTPVPVRNITNAVEISAGANHTCAVLATGEVYCWGYNNRGQLGDNSLTTRRIPVQVIGITTATQVTAGGSHTCAVLATGEVYCWGYNNRGQLGDNSTTTRRTPVQVSGITTATQVSAGFQHTCAVLATGEVYCWGYNNFGQLGDNSTTNRLVPVQASGITTATQVSAGYYHTCARLSTGVLNCWGRNSYGQIGDNTTTTRLVPAQVSGIANGTQVGAGGGTGGNTYEHSCALLSTGAVSCWGYNAYGELGNGGTTNSWVPVVVLLQ